MFEFIHAAFLLILHHYRLIHISLYVDTKILSIQLSSRHFPQPLAAVSYAACLYKYLFSLLSILKYLGVELLGCTSHLLFPNEKSHFFLFVCLFTAGSLLLLVSVVGVLRGCFG